jgi:hypothetical protein
MTTRVKFALRRDEASVWARSNPVLLDGEPGYDYTNNQIRIGHDGLHWNDLSPITAGGKIGVTGSTGPAGAASTIVGPQGNVGPQGAGAVTGSTGPRGPTGPSNTDPGPQGPQGDKGPAGPSSVGGGITGPTGPIGNTTTGNAGPDGIDGNQGSQGLQGFQGPQGDPGDQRKTIFDSYLPSSPAFSQGGTTTVISAPSTTYTKQYNLTNGTLQTTLPWGGVIRIRLTINGLSGNVGYDPVMPYQIQITLSPSGNNTYQIATDYAQNTIFAPLYPDNSLGYNRGVCSATIPIVCMNPIDPYPSIGITLSALPPDGWYYGNPINLNCTNGYTLETWIDVDNYNYFIDYYLQ